MKNTFRVRRISATVLGIDQKYLALGLAFAICLLLVAGMKAAGAVGPTQSPPSGNVTPNFTSITVNNTSTFKAGLDLQGPLKNNAGADTPVSIGDNLQVDGNSELKGNVNVTGNMSVTGDIKSKKIYNPESLPVRTYDFATTSLGGGVCKFDVKWNATVMYTQNVTDTGSDGTEKVSTTVDGDLVVAIISFPSCGVSPASQTVDRSNLNIADSSLLTGDLSIGGNLVVAGKVVGLQIPAQSNVFDNLTVNTALDVKGKIWNNETNKDLVIQDNLDLYGNLYSTLGGVEVTDDMSVSGKFEAPGIEANPDSGAGIGLLYLKKETHLQKPLLLHDEAHISSVAGSEVTIDGPVVISGDNPGDERVIKSDNNLDTISIGDDVTSTNLSIKGDLDANNFFGHQLKKSSCMSLYVVFGGGTGTTSASCGTGEYLLSCGYQAYTGSFLNKCLTSTASFSPTEVYPDYITSTCYVKASKSPSFKGIKAHAICTTKPLN